MMYDVIHAEVFHHPTCCHFVFTSEIVAHDLDTVVPSGFHRDRNRFHMRARHNHHVRGSRLRHHFRLEIFPTHRFHISSDSIVRKGRPQPGTSRTSLRLTKSHPRC